MRSTEKNLFLHKLIPPRPTIVQDMTEVERKVMQEHAAYWKGLMEDGIAIIFGVVLDPKCPWGISIVDAANESDVHTIVSNDPAVKVTGLILVVLYEQMRSQLILRPLLMQHV
jgi:uncharacterized protein